VPHPPSREEFIRQGLADADTADANEAPLDGRTEPGGASWFTPKPDVELGHMGRYALRRIIGTGGMGIVFEAHDPELDRVVALKVLRGTAHASGESRLRREGQIMARLTHPNVIRVYDVGVSNGHLFVAMEYIGGGTLATWLEEKPRTPNEILTAFVQAGRGLAAAHATGMVHRDFKPANVLVGTDGRVLVTDFGIARAASMEESNPPTPMPSPAPDAKDPAGSSQLTLTRTGELIGTPAYMAPEQFTAGPIDARADQFSFCVSLWRALYGLAPFKGNTFEELADSTGRGKLEPLPPSVASRAPTPVRVALERGLQQEPAKRFPSMNALLAAIEPRPSRRRVYLVGGGIAAVVAGAVTWAVVASRADDPCPAPTARVAQLWSEARAAGLRAHFVAIDPITGASRFAAAEAVMERAAPAWREMHVAACRATRVEGSQSDTLLDARMRCLDGWHQQAAAAVSGLDTAADATGLAGAVKAVGVLPSLARCADLVALQAAAQLPTDPAQHAEAVAILDELDAIGARFGRTAEPGARLGGKLEGLVERADALLGRARALDNPATTTKALAIRWRLSATVSDFPAAIGYLRELTEVAARGRDDTEAMHAWSMMGRLTATALGRPEEAKVMMSAARAAAARAGDSPPLVIEVLADEADVLRAAGDKERALANLTRARTLLAELKADEPGSPYAYMLAGTLLSIGETYWYADQHASAIAPLEEAIAIFDRALGPDTLEAASAYLDLAQVLSALGRADEAVVAVREAVRVRELRAGESSALAQGLFIQSDILATAGDLPDALAAAERAMAMGKAVLDPTDPLVTDIAISYAEKLALTGKRDEALAIYSEATTRALADGYASANVAIWLLHQANLEREMKRYDDAIAHYRAAGAYALAHDGPDSPLPAAALRAEAGVHLAENRAKEAMAALEKALPGPDSPRHAADAIYARATLGQLLYDSGRDRTRGLALVKEAVAAIQRSAEPAVTAHASRASIEAWLAKHAAKPK
jgi:tetratricopeptide (TPR) repeat protein